MKNSILTTLFIGFCVWLCFVMYNNSEQIITKEFTVIEKNKEDKQLVYLENDIHKTHTVEAQEFIDVEIGDNYQIKEYSWKFIIASIVLLFIICLAIIFNRTLDIADLFD